MVLIIIMFQDGAKVGREEIGLGNIGTAKRLGRESNTENAPREENGTEDDLEGTRR